MLVIAHRGANREALENSWQAFELAVASGAQRIEFDVHLSKDGHAAVNHDDDLSRTTQVRGRISEMTRSELEKVKMNNGERLPFLDQMVTRLLPRIELNIEIKGTSEALAAKVAEAAYDHPLRDKVIVSCFQSEPLVWLKRHAPDLKRACLWSSDTFQWPFFATLAPQVFLEKAGTNVLHPHVDLVDENLMDQARSRGWLVYAWVPMAGEAQGKESLWGALKTFGLHGLCTNHPREMRRWLSGAEDDMLEYRAATGGEAHV